MGTIANAATGSAHHQWKDTLSPTPTNAMSERYAHLAQTPVQVAADATSAAIERALSGETAPEDGAEVLPLRR